MSKHGAGPSANSVVGVRGPNYLDIRLGLVGMEVTSLSPFGRDEKPMIRVHLSRAVFDRSKPPKGPLELVLDLEMEFLAKALKEQS